MTVRTYAESVDEVLQHASCKKKLVLSLATMFDTLRIWNNPDDENYDTDRLREGLPPIIIKNGEMKGDLVAHATFRDDLVLEVFSHEVRSCRTLADLGAMFNRLQFKDNLPETVLQVILLKMLWIASGRASASEREAACSSR